MEFQFSHQINLIPKFSFSQLIIALPNLKNEKKRYIFEKFNNVNIFSVPLIKK